MIDNLVVHGREIITGYNTGTVHGTEFQGGAVGGVTDVGISGGVVSQGSNITIKDSIQSNDIIIRDSIQSSDIIIRDTILKNSVNSNINDECFAPIWAKGILFLDAGADDNILINSIPNSTIESGDGIDTIQVQGSTSTIKAELPAIYDGEKNLIIINKMNADDIYGTTQKEIFVVNLNMLDSESLLNRNLNQEPSICAIMNRLEFTSNNITAESENLQSAESTYTDGNMSKNITNGFESELLNNEIIKDNKIMIVASNFDNFVIL